MKRVKKKLLQQVQAAGEAGLPAAAFPNVLLQAEMIGEVLYLRPTETLVFQNASVARIVRARRAAPSLWSAAPRL